MKLLINVMNGKWMVKTKYKPQLKVTVNIIWKIIT